MPLPPFHMAAGPEPVKRLSVGAESAFTIGIATILTLKIPGGGATAVLLAAFGINNTVVGREAHVGNGDYALGSALNVGFFAERPVARVILPPWRVRSYVLPGRKCDTIVWVCL